MKTKRNIVLTLTLGMLILILMPVATAVKNGDIASIAIGHNGQIGGQCKAFAQHVVIGAGGSLGTGYTECYLTAGVEISENQAMWGDIIQISNDDDPECAILDGDIYKGMHTAIVLENDKKGNFKVVDSNFVVGNTVGIHSWNPVSWATQYNLDAHFYRLGTTDLWDFNIPPYTQGWEAHNVQATSVAPDGRFRINPERNDPWIQLDGLFLDVNDYDAIEINMASNAPDGFGKIYFTTKDSPGYGEDKQMEFYVINSGISVGTWKTYIIYMKNHPLWKGTITGIRIDPAISGKADAAGMDSIGFDWIKIIKTDKRPSITASDLDYSVYSPGNTINFKYWISNPFANDITDTKLYAAIRRSGTSNSWMEDNYWPYDKIVTLSSESYYEVKTYERSFQLPLSVSAGNYDVHLRIFNQNTNDLYDYEYLTSAFTVSESQPVIINPTPTPTPVPTYNPPPPTPTPTPTPVPTSTPTPIPIPTPAPNPILMNWHLVGNNGDAQAYFGVPSDFLKGRKSIVVIYDLHGLCAFGNDASAIIFDQGGWKFVSLSNYGQNCKNGEQTAHIALSDFIGLDPNANIGEYFHARFWSNSSYTVDIKSLELRNDLPTPTPIPFPAEDVNQDGAINVLDVDMISQHFGEREPLSNARCDIDGDGDVDISDLVSVAKNIA